MTREETKEEFNSYLDQLTDGTGFDLCKAQKAFAFKASEKFIPSWVSVEDRLPEDYERVLWIDKIDGNINLSYFVFSQSSHENVTHWQPLPQNPPTEE